MPAIRDVGAYGQSLKADCGLRVLAGWFALTLGFGYKHFVLPVNASGIAFASLIARSCSGRLLPVP